MRARFALWEFDLAKKLAIWMGLVFAWGCQVLEVGQTLTRVLVRGHSLTKLTLLNMNIALTMASRKHISNEEIFSRETFGIVFRHHIVLHVRGSQSNSFE